MQTVLFLVLGINMLIGFVTVEYIAYDHTRQDAVSELNNTADNIRGILMATRRVYHQQFLKSDVPLTEKTLGFLPAYALNRISKDFQNWEDTGISFNNVSDQPRNPHQKADKAEMEALDYFRENKQEEKFASTYENEKGDTYYLFAWPIWVEPYCLKCHGKKTEAPKTIQELYDTGFDYKVGDLRGVMSIKIPYGEHKKRIDHNFKQTTLIHFSVFISIFGMILLVSRFVVQPPLRRLTNSMTAFSGGDYSKRIQPLPGEFSILGRTFNEMAEKIMLDQKRLKQSEEKYKRVVDDTVEAIFLVDQKGFFIDMNKAAIRFFSDSETDLKTINFNSLFQNPQEWDNLKLKIEKNQSVFNHETRMLNKNQAPIFCKISATQWRDEYGRDLGYLGIIRDITESRRAKENLIISEAKLNKAQAIANMGSWNWIVSTDKLTWSKGVNVIFEVQPETNAGTMESFLKYAHPDDREAFNQAFEKVVRNKHELMIKHRVVLENGKLLDILIKADPVYDSAGEVVELDGIIQDITEQTRKERELKLARLTAESANEAKSDFLAKMSHELRTPLNGILGLVELTLLSGLDEEQKSNLEVVYSSGQALSKILCDILEISKIESGKIEFETIDFGIKGLIDELITLFEASAENKGLKLVDLSGFNDELFLRGDPTRLKQVFSNLLANAIKFTHQGEVRLLCEILKTTQKKIKLRFEVQDTGIGIDDESKSKIFDSFIQADSSITRQFGGTGLGLAITKQLVTQMGGKMSLESAPGHGSRFGFELSFNKSPLKAQKPKEGPGRLKPASSDKRK
ncbi:MAG: DUF3365 domain-containing protein, partial [Deltaproteobacteria bacterium]|nr:DUF3365 domain-containing protein [Deltaproteobacteria bacterium]